MARIELIGLDSLLKKVSKLGDPNSLFDKVVAKNARQSVRRLIDTTNKMTGTTRRGWTTPQKLGLSSYLVINNIGTTDKKHNIANILDQGRGEIFPRSAKRLYIPLTNKGRSKKSRAKSIKSNSKSKSALVYGVDYVLAKKAKSVPGTKFIQRERALASQKISVDVTIEIRKVLNGK